MYSSCVVTASERSLRVSAKRSSESLSLKATLADAFLLVDLWDDIAPPALSKRHHSLTVHPMPSALLLARALPRRAAAWFNQPL